MTTISPRIWSRKAIGYMKVVGHRPQGQLVAFEMVPVHGKTVWTIAVRRSSSQLVSVHTARFLGCVPSGH